MPRDFLHRCMVCGGWYCDGHLLLSDAGLLCGPCYDEKKTEIEERIRRAHQ